MGLEFSSAAPIALSTRAFSSLSAPMTSSAAERCSTLPFSASAMIWSSRSAMMLVVSAFPRRVSSAALAQNLGLGGLYGGLEREVIGSDARKRVAETSHLNERGRRIDPDAVETEHRAEGGKRRHKPVLAEVFLQPRERPAVRPPFVEIAHDERHARALVCEESQELRHLAAALVGAEAEMRHDHAHRLAVDLQVGVDRAARLVAPDRHVQLLGVQNGKAREQRVAEFAVAPLEEAARHGVQAGRRREEIRLVRLDSAVGFDVDFLQANDVGAARLDHLADARRVALAVEAQAFVNVVRERGEERHGG